MESVCQTRISKSPPGGRIEEREHNGYGDAVCGSHALGWSQLTAGKASPWQTDAAQIGLELVTFTIVATLASGVSLRFPLGAAEIRLLQRQGDASFFVEKSRQVVV